MPPITNLAGADTDVLQETIGAYSEEAYTTAKKLSGTAIVGPNPDIDVNTETFVGQLRWLTPLNPTINVASLTDATAGTKTTYGSDYLKYIKTVRTHGAEQVNMKQVVTQHNGLQKIGKDFGITRSQDEHNAILSVLRGIALTEMLYGAGSASGSAGLGGQTFENDPTSKRYGFYVDLGAAAPVVAASTTSQGAARAEGFLNAFGMAYKDYEPEYAYLVTSPAIMASLRSANLVDQTTVTEGNVTFSTIFNGKFRIIQTRAQQGFTAAELAKINTMAGVDIVGAKCSFIVLPGSVAMENLDVPIPTEITRDGNAYKGGGTSSIWYRWGYVLAPAGYDWIGSETVFPSDADYMKVYDTAEGTDAFVAVGSATDASITNGTWARKTTSALSLGILPVFHS